MESITAAEFRKLRGLPEEEQDSVLKRMSPESREAYLASLPPPERFFVIDGAAGLFLSVGKDDADSLREEVAEEFLRSWKRVGDDRARIVSSWRAAGPGFPTILLESGLALVGKYDANEYLFGFNMQAMDCALRDGKLGDVIGHELGHSWHHTFPDSAMSHPGPVTPELVKAREDEANAKALSWEFDMHGLEAWGNANRKLFAEMTNNPAYLDEFTPVV